MLPISLNVIPSVVIFFPHYHYVSDLEMFQKNINLLCHTCAEAAVLTKHGLILFSEHIAMIVSMLHKLLGLWRRYGQFGHLPLVTYLSVCPDIRHLSPP